MTENARTNLRILTSIFVFHGAAGLAYLNFLNFDPAKAESVTGYIIGAGGVPIFTAVILAGIKAGAFKIWGKPFSFKDDFLWMASLLTIIFYPPALFA